MLDLFADFLGHAAVGSVLALLAFAVWCVWDCRRQIAYHARMIWQEWRAR